MPILTGNAAFEGSTLDNTFCLTIEQRDDKMIKTLENLINAKKELDETKNKLEAIVDYLITEGKYYIVEEALGMNQEDDMLSSYIQQTQIEKEHDDNYGWLSPLGNFYTVEFGDHQEWAKNTLKRRDVDNQKLLYPGDTLYDKGWILLHSPSKGIPEPTGNLDRMTKRQGEFLYDYYTKRGLTHKADEIWEKYKE